MLKLLFFRIKHLTIINNCKVFYHILGGNVIKNNFYIIEVFSFKKLDSKIFTIK